MLRALALLFLKLGLTAFGGPAAHVARMREEVVERRGWMTDDELLEALAIVNLLPGPNSTELAIEIGRKMAGTAGLVVAGACFILPAALITLALAWVYVRFGALPRMQGVLWAVKPVMIAVVGQALIELGKKAIKSWREALLALAACGAAFFSVNELLVLLLAGLAALLFDRGHDGPKSGMWLGPLSWFAPLSVGTKLGLLPIFVVFLKMGAVLFGSGYVLLAFLRADLVDARHWLTMPQLLDAVAVGQVTPGPVFTTATFVGYLLFGTRGAIAATLGIFLPAFLLVTVSGPISSWARRSAGARRFLLGVSVGSLALMAMVALQLARAALVDRYAIAIGVAAALFLVKVPKGSMYAIGVAALIGALTRG